MGTQDMTFLLLLLLANAVIAMPLLRYLAVGWRAKQADVTGGQTPAACLEYFKMFSRDGAYKPNTPDEALVQFKSFYKTWYGRRLYVLPALLLLVISTVTVGALLAAELRPPAMMPLNSWLDQIKPPAIGAIAGAYVWVANDYIWRARRLDFAPSDVHWGVLRLTIAVPLGYAFASLDASHGAFIAFALGAFPLSTILTMLRRIGLKWLRFEESDEEAEASIAKLQGINRDILERLANEDITTITQIAYCDPVRLTMRSNLSFNFVTDCMNQALAWVYLEDKLCKLRCLGLKGAVEIKHLVEDIKKPEEKARAAATLAAAAEVAKQSPETLMTAFAEIINDSFTKYLWEVWE